MSGKRKPKLKIYTQDHSWAGCIIVIASSEEAARELMKPCYNYDPNEPIETHDITDGFVYYNTGDL